MRARLSVASVLALSILASCRGPREPAREPAGLVLGMPRPPGAETTVSGIAIWQGWRMSWGYNHRLNRTGALLEQIPCRTDEVPEARCRARMTLSAASGSGTDTAELEAHFALVAARGVLAASATREIVVRGFEGEVLQAAAEVVIPVSPELARMERRWALLSGFDIASLGSADKLKQLGIHVGPPTLRGNEVRVPIAISGVFACSSLECPPRERVDSSVLVGVTLLGSDGDALGVRELDVEVAYDWDDREELGDDAGVVALDAPPSGIEPSVWAVRGFSVELDSEMHLVDFGMSVSPVRQTASRPEMAFILRNWRKKMRNERPPMSWFSYRSAGRAVWKAELLQLDFRKAAVAHRVWQTELPWRGDGKPPLDAAAERTQMLYWEVHR